MNAVNNRASFFKAPLSNAQLFMMIALVSWAMLFGTLVLSLLLARARSGVWPPEGVQALDPVIPIFSTLILLASSFFLHKGQRAFKRDDLKMFKSFWGLALFSACLFLVLQILTLGQWWTSGVRHSDHLYTSSVFVFIIFHGLHVLLALGGLLRKYYQPKSASSLQLWGWFWHFIDVVWLVTMPVLLL